MAENKRKTEALEAEPSVAEHCLEDQLANALGLALICLSSGQWNNRDIARMEAPFKAWCDKVVSGSAIHG